jgi:hypothetical protein
MEASNMERYTNQELKDKLADCRVTIEQYEGYGAAWALDSRTMRIAQATSYEVYGEIQRRMAAGTWE